VRPADRFRHKLGLGKPLGLGRVVIDPLALAFHDRTAMYGPKGLFGPRYASFEWLGGSLDWDSLPGSVQRRYTDERNALARKASPKEPFPAADALRAEVRKAMPEATRWTLELLGDPAAVAAEVTYPVLAGQTTEGEHFRWFVQNERKHRKPLPAIPTGGSLPLLEKYPQPVKKPPKKRGHR